MRLICAYSAINEAVKDCDICHKFLCKICGYRINDMDYCNECWALYEKDDSIDAGDKEHMDVKPIRSGDADMEEPY